MSYNEFLVSNLIRHSAKQIRFLKEQKPVLVKEEDPLIRKAIPSLETTFSYGTISIKAQHSLLLNDKLVIIKTVKGTPEDWYLQNSLVQCALSKSLVMVTNGIITRNGEEVIEVDPNIKYILHFGDDEYNIEVSDPKLIINYFFKKALAVCKSYEKCIEYDLVHNHKHFQDLKDLFSYIRLLEPEMLIQL
jgi:hypothetical protein